MIDPSVLVTVIELGSKFLKKIARDEKVEDAYNNLIASLEKRGAIPSSLRDQLMAYQVERDELLNLLKQHIEASNDTKNVEAAQKLLVAIEQAGERTHALNLDLLQSVYKRYVAEQKEWTRFSIIVALSGFLLIFIGIASIYFVNITTGIVVTVAGIVANLTSALFFRQASNATLQMNSVYEKQVELENVRLSTEILSDLWTRLNDRTASISG